MSTLTPRAMAEITQARLTLGPRGRAADTQTALAFALDHARAREAVLSELDVARVGAALDAAQIAHVTVTSQAETRDAYIRRPDLGRHLSTDDAKRLKHDAPDVALVLGDGLSAIAVALNGAAFIAVLAERLTAQGLSFGPVVLARQARVALGDEIARATGAQTVVMALGERPGLSAADSLGVYITHRPDAQTADSARNCISNIRAAGTSVADAAAQAEGLILAMRDFGASGVALNSAGHAPRITSGD